MATVEAYTDEQIDDAIEVIERYNPRAAAAVIARLDEAGEKDDEEAFNAAAARALQLAESLEREQNEKAEQEKRPPTTRVGIRTRGAIGREASARVSGAGRVLGVAALFFGLCIWVPGAHYQLDGWTLVVNAVLDLVRADYVVPIAAGWWALLLFPIGIVHSIGERKYLPLWKTKRGWQFLGWGVLFVWILINGADLLSAYIGIIQPPAPDAWPITLRMAQTPWMQVVWMLTVVYIGDVLIALGWHWLGIRLPRLGR